MNPIKKDTAAEAEVRLNRIKEIALRRAETQRKSKLTLAPRPERRFNFMNRKANNSK